ncbi:hypothetical protein LU11_gp063 [Pseudomonas phage Lu11]|uniref:hypothetical protein n=1 Tax=Pseudomonas phage Lu11 TaxID=1161927 RepID=UPI00025F1519|nr:hypothetical protein LU11_gp063 [Pseudomonas phage Lu11]AFH14594.1 hypothetical protein Lu11_0063 [Pseudomonas phage Lu11]
MSDTAVSPSLRAAMRERDLFGNHSFKQTHLHLSFAAIRASLKKFFKLKDLPFVHNNDVKQIMRASAQPEYPYAYVSMTSIAKTEGGMSGPTLRRRGVGHVVDGSNSTLTSLHYFPVTLQYEFHYVTNDYFDAIRFIGEALILFDSKVLNVKIKSGLPSSFLDITTDTKEIQLPRADKDNEAEPEAFDLVINCHTSTWTGIERKISKVNNRGEVEFNSLIVDHEGNVVDEETSIIQTADDV